MSKAIKDSVYNLLKKTIAESKIKDTVTNNEQIEITLIDSSVITLNDDFIQINLLSIDRTICRQVTNFCINLKARAYEYEIKQHADILEHKHEHEHVYVVTISTTADGALEETEEIYAVRECSKERALIKALSKEGLPYYEDNPHTVNTISLDEEGICHLDTVYVGYTDLLGGMLDE